MFNNYPPHQREQIKGAIIGFIAPLLSSPLVCLFLFWFGEPKKIDDRGFITGTYTYFEFYLNLISNPSRLPIFISLCALINLAVFYMYLQKKREWLARGMIYTTLLYTVIYFILKIF